MYRSVFLKWSTVSAFSRAPVQPCLRHSSSIYKHVARTGFEPARSFWRSRSAPFFGGDCTPSLATTNALHHYQVPHFLIPVVSASFTTLPISPLSRSRDYWIYCTPSAVCRRIVNRGGANHHYSHRTTISG